jgi:Lar family restriction alleviation protein
MKKIKLLRCPFCGGKAAWGEGEQKTKYGNEQVYCSDCYAITAPEGSKEEAAANWNSRVEG